MLIMVLALVLNSCSSDNSSDTAPTPAPANTAEYFNYKIDGETISVTQWQGYRSENTIEVVGTGSNGKSIFINFNSLGNIGRVNAYSSTPGSGIPSRVSQAYYTNQSFTFNLVSVDDINKTVKGTFSGKVYENGFDLTSPFVLVEGDFQVKYTQITPDIAGLGVYAKIAGNDWYSSKGDSTGGFSSSDLTLKSYNGGVYRIGITINPGTLATGTLPFTPTSTVNKVVLSKYNTNTRSFDDYNCTGSFNVTNKQALGQKTIITGTYSFTAVDPVTSTSITVSNGTFKTSYSN